MSFIPTSGKLHSPSSTSSAIPTYPGFIGTAAPTLRAAAKHSILRMLALDSSDPAHSSPSHNDTTNFNSNAMLPIQWKVLIMDSTARDILSPLVTVAELRDAGVTVHMALHSARQPIPDVPAVYLCDPTSAAIVRIAEDLTANLYDSYFLNFISPLPRHLLEDLAQRLVTTQSAHLVSKVMDQYLPLCVLDDHLASLSMPSALSTLHSPSSPETDINNLIDSMAIGLLSICITLGVVPYVRFPVGGNPAEMLGRNIESKLRDALLSSTGPAKISVFDPDAPRPVLLLLDRTADLGSALAHSWLYAPLVHDVLEFKLNRVSCLTEDKPGGPKVKKTFDLDATDFFWKGNAGTPFPEVAEKVDADLAQYKKDAQDLLSATGAKSLEEMGQMDAGLNAKHLKTAITQLPMLTARKRTLDSHMHIATALLGAIQSRKLDMLYEAEQKPTKSSVLELLPQLTSPSDATRFVLVYVASAGSDSGVSQDVDEVVKALAKSFPDNPHQGAVTYVKSLRSLAMAAISSTTSSSGGGGHASSIARSGTPSLATPDFLGRFGRFTETLTQASTQIAAGGSIGLGNAVESIVGGVKSLVIGGRYAYMARRVDAVLDGVEEPGMITLDPRVSSNSTSTAKSRTNVPRSSTPGSGSKLPSGVGNAGCMVCVVGGGSWLEYLQVLRVAQSKKRPVLYTASDIVSPNEFLNQLVLLGNQQKPTSS